MSDVTGAISFPTPPTLMLEPVAILRLGHAETFCSTPMQELKGRMGGRPSQKLAFLNTWGRTEQRHEP